LEEVDDMDTTLLEKALESGEPFAVAIAIIVFWTGAVRKWGPSIPWLGKYLGEWLKSERNVILLAVVGAVGTAVLGGLLTGASLGSIVVAGLVAGLGAMGASTAKKLVKPNVKDNEIARLEELVAVEKKRADNYEESIRSYIKKLPAARRNEEARMALEEELKAPR